MRVCLLLLILLSSLPISDACNLTTHPRILFTKTEEAAVKKRIKSDPLAADIYKEQTFSKPVF